MILNWLILIFIAEEDQGPVTKIRGAKEKAINVKWTSRTRVMIDWPKQHQPERERQRRRRRKVQIKQLVTLSFVRSFVCLFIRYFLSPHRSVPETMAERRSDVEKGVDVMLSFPLSIDDEDDGNREAEEQQRCSRRTVSMSQEDDREYWFEEETGGKCASSIEESAWRHCVSHTPSTTCFPTGSFRRHDNRSYRRDTVDPHEDFESTRRSSQQRSNEPCTAEKNSKANTIEEDWHSLLLPWSSSTCRSTSTENVSTRMSRSRRWCSSVRDTNAALDCVATLREWTTIEIQSGFYISTLSKFV